MLLVDFDWSSSDGAVDQCSGISANNQLFIKKVQPEHKRI